MDDMTSKLSELLSDPASIERIKNMAAGLFSNNEEVPVPAASETKTAGLPDIDLGKAMSVMSRLNSMNDDNRSGLLLALKPHLSQKRQQRVDNAVKILKLTQMLPLLQDSGIFNF